MRNLLLFALFLTLLSTQLPAQWTKTNGPAGVRLETWAQVGEQIWLGTTGGLYISNDNGSNWVRSEMFDADDLIQNISVQGTEIILTTKKLIPYHADPERFLHHSFDFGVTWQVKPISSDFYGINLIRTNDVLLFVDAGTSLRSFDFGTTWEGFDMPINPYSATASNGKLLISGYSGVHLSHDLGDTWTEIAANGGKVPVIFEENIIVFDYNEKLYTSHDLGVTWSIFDDFEVDEFENLISSEFGNYYALGDENSYFSIDKGLTWQLFYQGEYDDYLVNLVEVAVGEYLVRKYDRHIYHYNVPQGLSFSESNLFASDVHDMFALTNGDLIASADQGIFRTSDGGETWNQVFEPALKPDFNAVYADGQLIVMNDGKLYSSVDNLQSMTQLSLTSFGNNATLMEYHDGYLYIGRSYFRRSADFGQTWEELQVFDGNNEVDFYEDLHFLDEDNWLLTAGEGIIFRTENKGGDWAPVAEFWGPGSRSELLYQVEERLILVDNLQWLYSDDAGFTWIEFVPVGYPKSDSNRPINHFNLEVVGDVMYVTTEDGVYISSDLGITWSGLFGGLQTQQCQALEVVGDNLFLGTYSNGVYKSKLDLKAASGTAFVDLNFNGIQDPEDIGLPHLLIKSDSEELLTSTRQDGSYQLYGNEFNHTVRPVSPFPYATIVPEYYDVNDNTDNLNFAFQFASDINDLCITTTNLNPFRPGFDNSLILTISNVGTTILEPSVTLTLPDNLNYIAAEPAPTQINGQDIAWSLPAMGMFESIDIEVKVNLSTMAMIGDLLSIFSLVDPLDLDEAPLNNSYGLRESVVGSFDPNDKQVSPADYFTPDQFEAGEAMSYTIRFQNTGNYHAQHVKIIDTLDQQFDLNTLNVLSASHDYNFSLRSPNVLEFNFPDILLPDSTNNEPESHGFIKFEIQPKESINLDATISNFADIYFDFNLPIRTNTAAVVYGFPLSVFGVGEDVRALEIFPNPNNGLFQYSIEQTQVEKGNLDIYNAQGKLIKTIRDAATSGKLDTSSFARGTYFMIWKGENPYVGKLVIL